MSIVSTSGPPKRPRDESDPFRLGWRYVRVQQPDGTETIDQVPLTEEDVLFPEEGDFIVQTDFHSVDINYLKVVFNARLAHVPNARALCDCRVDWNVPGLRPLGPDIAVFFGVRRRKDWATLKVAGRGSPAGAGGRGHLAQHAQERRGDQGRVLSPCRRAAVRHRRRGRTRRGGPAPEADRLPARAGRLSTDRAG